MFDKFMKFAQFNPITVLTQLSQLADLKHFDPIMVTDQLSSYVPEGMPKDMVKKRLLDVLVTIGVPFNRWLGYRIQEFTPERVTVESPPTVLRRNHVGTAHACAQALLGEMPAGLLVAQKYPLEEHRMIISKLEIEYFKAGRGTLFGKCEAPAEWPELVDDEAWVEMVTKITNDNGELISECRTRWQVKTWAKITADKIARNEPQDEGEGAGDAKDAGRGDGAGEF
jgi:acyl-coenzyme A thioesterase PaaI-like protein